MANISHKVLRVKFPQAALVTGFEPIDCHPDSSRDRNYYRWYEDEFVRFSVRSGSDIAYKPLDIGFNISTTISI